MIKTVNYNGSKYIIVIPVKKLFQSTTVHDVITRGDLLAVNIATGELTVLPGNLVKSNCKIELTLVKPVKSKLATPNIIIVKSSGTTRFCSGKYETAISQIAYEYSRKGAGEILVCLQTFADKGVTSNSYPELENFLAAVDIWYNKLLPKIDQMYF